MRAVPHPVLPYLVAIAAAVFATATRMWLDPILGDSATFVTFALAVAVAAWWGGRGPGLFALALCSLSAWYWFVSAFPVVRQVVGLGLFVVVAYGIVWMFDTLRRTQAELARARDESEAERRKVEALRGDLERRAAELEQANAALRQADQEKNTFVAAIAHELRNPLQPILSTAHVLAAPSIEPQAVAEVAKVIERQAGQAARIVEDLLDLSRVALGRLQLHRSWVRLDEVIEAALEQVEHSISSKRQRVEIDGALTAATWADRERLVQVFANLLANASKFTPDGGMVHVTAKSADDGVAVTIRDNGSGIAPEFLPSIFNLYVQQDPDAGARSRGLGLGLALSKTLMELHGGRIEARSDGPQKGAAFTLWLPRHAPGSDDAWEQAAPVAA